MEQLNFLGIIFDGMYYFVWATEFQHFLHIHDKLAFIIDDPPMEKDPSYHT